MALDIDNINHVGMAARDLTATSARFEALGFLLTPFSVHSGAWKPGEKVQPFASGNRCVMFPDNYLEILASENAANPSPRIAGYLRHHQGAHIICFNSDHIEAMDKRLTNAGIKTSGVIPLQRDIEMPEGMRTAKFQRAQFAPDDLPEGYIQAAKHLTPEYIYLPRYTAHPNECDRLTETIIVSDDFEHFVDKYSRYLDLRPSRQDETATFVLPAGSRLTIATSRAAVSMLPGTLYPPLPGIVAVAFRTRNLSGQRQRLARASITHNENGNRLIVPAEEASGLVVIFEGPQ